jgi:hypothetical protein
MQSTLTVQALVWVVMAVVVGSLAVYRKYVSRAEVDVLHLGETESLEIPRQEAMAHRLESIDRWGKILTVALIVYGVAIACGFGYFAWQSTSLPIS